MTLNVPGAILTWPAKDGALQGEKVIQEKKGSVSKFRIHLTKEQRHKIALWWPENGVGQEEKMSV